MSHDDYSGRNKVDTARADDSHMHSIFAPTQAVHTQPTSKARTSGSKAHASGGASTSETHDGIRGKSHGSYPGDDPVETDDIEGLDPDATVVELDHGMIRGSDEPDDESITKPAGSWRDRVKKAKLQEEIAKDRRQQRLETAKAKLAVPQAADGVKGENSSTAGLNDADSTSARLAKEKNLHADEKVIDCV